MIPDFTLEKYSQLCDAIQQLACPVMTVEQFLEAGQPRGLTVVLRHDIDRGLASAMRMAKLESVRGIQATYYVRITRSVFQEPRIKQLRQLGHEIGYHYEVLARARGDKKRAAALFERELEHLRAIAPIRTSSMHGSPLSRWSNLDIWQAYDFKDYDLVGDFSLSIRHADVHYFTDTGRSWDPDRHNLRDRVASLEPSRKVITTDDLIRYLGERPDRAMIINTHPSRWACHWSERGMSTVSDWIANQLKLIIARVWRQGSDF